ncbi:hypothetical protein OEG92_03040 [Polaribacter sejongensis]|uniref:hypothetical protein n=1 Tax=Polaribacter sejongensis TaxID=985043 RepID=UPI0035A60DA9
MEAYKQQVGSGVTEMQASKNVWDNIVRKKSTKINYQKQELPLVKQMYGTK